MRRVLDELRQAEAAARNEALGSTLRDAIPVVQRHLTRAREIQRRMRGASGATAAGGATPEH